MKKLILILASIALTSCGTDIGNNIMVVPPGCAVYKPANKTYYAGVCLGNTFVYVWQQADGSWLMAAYQQKKVKFYYKDDQGKWLEFDSKMPNPDLPPDVLQDQQKPGRVEVI